MSELRTSSGFKGSDSPKVSERRLRCSRSRSRSSVGWPNLNERRAVLVPPLHALRGNSGGRTYGRRRPAEARLTHRSAINAHVSAGRVTHYLEQLGTDETEHTHGSLREHLRGTYALLAGWGASEETCLAGLFHSIYGTEKFKTTTIPLDQRDNVRHRIGDEAERLVYLDAVLDARPCTRTSNVAGRIRSTFETRLPSRSTSTTWCR